MEPLTQQEELVAEGSSKETEEGVCPECDGTGEISTMEYVYPGEPHMAPIGTRPCPYCSHDNEDDNPED